MAEEVRPRPLLPYWEHVGTKKKIVLKFYCGNCSFVMIPHQFGALLDENTGSKFENIGLNAMANTDKAGRNPGVIRPFIRT